MGLPRTALRWLLVLLAGLIVVVPAGAREDAYQTGFTPWRAGEGGFAGWQLDGAGLSDDGELCLLPVAAQRGTDPYPDAGYHGGNFYNGGDFLVGEATGPAVPADFALSEAIASWNADTPPGTWIETLIRAQLGERWTKWYSLGVWAADDSTVSRHSVDLQGDADGYVATDTLVLTEKEVPATAFQLKVRLFSSDGAAVPIVRNLSVACSTAAPKAKELVPGNPALWDTVLAVPECSQMVYPNGGSVWCSPTSTSMVLGYWGIQPGPCEPRVRATVEGVYDWVYDGHGNWPFNTAYAATHGLEAYVARFTSLAQAEEWIAAGVPVVMSFAWENSDLAGVAIPSSGGHVVVLAGFDAAGNPVVNDPAAASDAEVQRVYDRAEFETLWLENSGGMVYLIYPAGWEVPAFPG